MAIDRSSSARASATTCALVTIRSGADCETGAVRDRHDLVSVALDDHHPHNPARRGADVGRVGLRRGRGEQQRCQHRQPLGQQPRDPPDLLFTPLRHARLLAAIGFERKRRDACRGTRR